MNVKYTCPCCGHNVKREHFACRFASKGGAAGRGKSKARSSEQARKAVMARWSRVSGKVVIRKVE